jgi:hypothetical protein
VLPSAQSLREALAIIDQADALASAKGKDNKAQAMQKLQQLRSIVAAQRDAAETRRTAAEQSYTQCENTIVPYNITLGRLIDLSKSARTSSQQLANSHTVLTGTVLLPADEIDRLLVDIDNAMKGHDQQKRLKTLLHVSKQLEKHGLLRSGTTDALAPRKPGFFEELFDGVKKVVIGQTGVAKMPDPGRELLALRALLQDQKLTLQNARKDQLKAHSQLAMSNAYAILQEDLRSQLAASKQKMGILKQAKEFWQLTEGILNNQIVGDVKHLLEDLQQRLNKELPRKDFDELWKADRLTLKDVLVNLYQAYDNDIAQQGQEVTCAGPEAIDQQIIAIQRCNIQAGSYPYYRIIDPRTCSYQHTNPPGCPPSIRKPPRLINQAQKHREQMLSIVDEDANWIGTARCNSDKLYFYGKVEGASACRGKCVEDGDCGYWTYNRRNGTIPDTHGECWGAALLGAPPASPGTWEGFISGGMPYKMPLPR